MYTTSGMKQDENGNFYMIAVNTITGKQMRIEVESKETLQAVVIDATSKAGHLWKYNKQANTFEPSTCGVFGCACCDAKNLATRLDRLKSYSF